MGAVEPATFIRIAEEADLIIELDHQVLDASLARFGPSIRAGQYRGTVSVNLAAQHFYRDNLVTFVVEKLKEHDFPADRLELEITEGTVMRNASEAIQVMNELRELGVRLSIDDFGTGYSSLAYLRQFPVQSLKIDLSFIRDMFQDRISANLVQSIVSLAHALNLECIAEGVETEDQARALCKVSCNTLQGNLFAPAGCFDSIGMYLDGDACFRQYVDLNSH